MKKAFYLNMILLASCVFGSASSVYAADTIGIQVESPTWCRGQNSLGQCVTFFGSKESCNNIEPCNKSELQRYVTPVVTGDLHYCYGMNSLDQCVLFLGSKESCANVSPCTIGFEFLKD